MFNNVALDVVIGLVFIFLLYSMLATIIQEIIATKLSFRSKILQKAILRMLEDGKTTTMSPFFDVIYGFYQLIFRTNALKNKRFATAFYTHPLIKYLTEDNWFSKPAYISSKNFSKVIIDLLHGIDPDSQGLNLLKIKESITNGYLKDNLKTNDPANPANKEYKDQNVTKSDTVSSEIRDINPETKLFLESLLVESKGDVERLKVLLEQWFDDTMERATGWYKRYTQYILLILGFIIAVTFNVDSIAIYKILSKDKPARDQLVQMAIASKDKFEPEVDRQRRLAKGDTTRADDALLNNTYKMIVEDADKSSHVMGLGRPWKDSCKICSSLKKDSTKKDKLQLAKDSSDRYIDSSKMTLILFDSITNVKKALGDKKLKFPNQKFLDSLEKRKTYTDGVVKLKIPQVREFDSLQLLTQRCSYIKNEIGDKWFKYSPNQAGDFETFLGWLITALAISLGAPFWFDLLSKLIRLRGSREKVDSSDSTGSSSGQNASAPVTVNINPNPGEEAVG